LKSNYNIAYNYNEIILELKLLQIYIAVLENIYSIICHK
ncbi:unnamed protein product, partial [marine sediment metagenome]